MSTAPWDIYAEQMMHLGYGYPLWVPDPAPGSAPVEIGDVGWINEGEFLPLFNAFRGEHEAQPRGAVPVDHVRLDIHGCTVVGPRDKISQSVLCSRSIRRVDVSGEIAATVVPPNVSCNVNFSFECTDEAGALLFLGPSGRTQDVLSKQRIMNYMDAHFDRWLEFANDRLGLGLKEDQIMFVSGTTKTSRWGVAAFRGATREKRGTVSGSLNPLAAVDFSFSISDAQLSTSHYRAGPTERSSGTPCSWGSPREEHDQCVFIHYYKRKRRKWSLLPTVMKAAAGPHDLPGGPRDDTDGGCCVDVSEWEDSDSSSDEFQRFPVEDRAKDPADYILDYILENSSAMTAIASDMDIFSLPHGELPDRGRLGTLHDMSQQLATLEPAIFTSENGLGSLHENPMDGDEIAGTPHSDHPPDQQSMSSYVSSLLRDLDVAQVTRNIDRHHAYLPTQAPHQWVRRHSQPCGSEVLSTPSISSLPPTRAFQTILTGRKCYRVSKFKEDVVWPSHLEAALIEGLEKYTPAESKAPRGLPRFPNRNKFVSQYILQETGQIRTAKQVGSRIQQLRDIITYSNVLLPEASKVRRKMEPNSTNEYGQLDPLAQTSGIPLRSSSPWVANVDISVFSSASETSGSDDIWSPFDQRSYLPPPAPIDVEPNRPHAFMGLDPTSEVSPTVTVISPRCSFLLSRCNLFRGGALLESDSPVAMAISASHDGSPVAQYLHSARVSPAQWDMVANSDDPSAYTIAQEILNWPDDASIETLQYYIAWCPAIPSGSGQFRRDQEVPPGWNSPAFYHIPSSGVGTAPYDMAAPVASGPNSAIQYFEIPPGYDGGSPLDPSPQRSSPNSPILNIFYHFNRPPANSIPPTPALSPLFLEPRMLCQYGSEGWASDPGSPSTEDDAEDDWDCDLGDPYGATSSATARGPQHAGHLSLPEGVDDPGDWKLAGVEGACGPGDTISGTKDPADLYDLGDMSMSAVS